MRYKKTLILLLICVGLVGIYVISVGVPTIGFLLSVRSSEVTSEELLRIRSPDFLVDAVLMRSNAGATGAHVYRVSIVPSGTHTKDIEEHFRADHLKGYKLVWKAPKLLEVQFEEGRIYHFSNFWQSKDVKDGSYVVEIRLVPLSGPFSLSPEDRWVGK